MNELLEKDEIEFKNMIYEIKLLQDTFKQFKPGNNHIFFSGQMQIYVNYYDREIKNESDNKTIFSSEFKLAILSEKEFIDVIENKKKNMEVV